MFLRILALCLWGNLIWASLRYDIFSLPEISFGWLGIPFVFDGILATPISEEFIVRYWIYGQNKLLRIGSFIGFVGILLFVIFSFTGAYAINQWMNTPFVITGLLSIVVSTVIGSRLHFGRLIPFFDRLRNSWVFFGVMVIVFTGLHFEAAGGLSLAFEHLLIISILLTYVAKKYSVFLAIVVHAFLNTTGILAGLEFYDLVGLMDRGQVYLLFGLSLFWLGVYYWSVNRLRKDLSLDFT